MKYLQEMNIKILAVLFFKIAYLPILNSNYEFALSIESKRI